MSETKDEEQQQGNDPSDAEGNPFSGPPEPEESPRVFTKLVGNLQDEAFKVARAVLDRKPPGQDSVERFLEVLLKVLNRREVLERILRSDFMHNLRDMQSEFTEALGIASQHDAQELRQQMTEIIERLDKLQKTLDEIVVEVEDA